MIKLIKEEIAVVISLPDLIGSLGMFFGVSISAYVGKR